MQTIEQLYKRIHNAQDLHTIVRTMKTLAAINIYHYERTVDSIGEFYRTVELGLQVVLQKGPLDIFLKKKSDDTGICSIIFGTDQGLCGGFNDKVVSYAIKELKEREIPDDKQIVIVVGSRTQALLHLEGYSVEKVFHIPLASEELTEIVYEVVTTLDALQRKGKVQKIVLFYNKLVSNISYNPHTIQLLPLDPEWLQRLAKKKWPTYAIPMFTMDREKLFSQLIQQYIFVSLYRAFAESMASENAARLSSMQAAEKNIQERIEKFYTLYHQRRQESITSELLDILSGFEALQSPGE